MDLPPCLHDELLDPLLATAAVLTLCDPDRTDADQLDGLLVTLATVLPRNLATLLTSTVLNQYAKWITLDAAFALGDVDLLNRLVRLSHSHGRPLQYTAEAITLACKHGRVCIMDWCFGQSGLLFHWTGDAIDQASAHGQVEILEWWAARCQSGRLPFSAIKYSTEAVTQAIANNHMSVLHWWGSPKSNPFTLKVHPFTATIAAVSSRNWAAIEWLESRSLASYHTQTLGHACRTGDLDMVVHVHNQLQSAREDDEAWNRVDLMKWRPVNEDNPFWIATEQGHLHVLDWLVDTSGYEPEWSGGWRYLNAAVASGSSRVCEWWATRFGTSVLGIDNLKSGLARACALGHVPIVDWIASQCTGPGYESGALAPALIKVCANGHVNILDWIVKDEPHILPEICTEHVQELVLMLHAASAHGCVHVLDWFASNNLLNDLDLTRLDVLNLASASGHVDVLNWLVHSFPNIRFPYSNRALDIASRNCHIPVLDWWVNQRPQRSLKYSSAALHVPCTRQGFATLRWWIRQHQLGIVTLPKLGTRMVHSLMDHGQVTLLAMLHQLGLVPIEAVDAALDTTSYHGHVCILEWIVLTRPTSQLQYSDRAMLEASRRGFVHVLEWWVKQSGLPLKVPAGIDEKSKLNDEVRRWWDASGQLPLNN